MSIDGVCFYFCCGIFTAIVLFDFYFVLNLKWISEFQAAVSIFWYEWILLLSISMLFGRAHFDGLRYLFFWSRMCRKHTYFPHLFAHLISITFFFVVVVAIVIAFPFPTIYRKQKPNIFFLIVKYRINVCHSIDQLQSDILSNLTVKFFRRQ